MCRKLPRLYGSDGIERRRQPAINAAKYTDLSDSRKPGILRRNPETGEAGDLSANAHLLQIRALSTPDNPVGGVLRDRPDVLKRIRAYGHRVKGEA